MSGDSSMSRRRIWPRTLAPPLISILTFLFFWEVLIQSFNVPVYLLPAPTHIIASLAANAGLVFQNAKPTIYESSIGFLISVPLGTFLAILTVWSKGLGKAVMPLLVFSQSIPKISVAPLLLVWFGFGLTSKVLVVFMMAFFPIFLSMLSGLKSVERELLDMMTCMRPSKMQVFIKVRIPNSLPFLLDGFKLGITRSVLGAVAAEWISSDQGLGHLIIYADASMNSPLLFATIAILATIGMGLFILVNALGRLIVPWYFALRRISTLQKTGGKT